MTTAECLISSDNYGELDTKGKRIVILDYFFRKYNELGKFTYIKPRDFKKDYKLTSNQQRTLNRNFKWFWDKYIFIDNTESKELDVSSLSTEYKIRTQEDDVGTVFTYNIPTDPIKRKHYSTLLVGLLHDSNGMASNIPFFSETAQMNMNFITQLSDKVIQDVLLASRIYSYYKCSQGNLLNIIALLSHYKKSLWIEFKNGQKIQNGIIESIAIYEDGIIELSINDKIVTLKEIDEISNIFILSAQYPSTNYGVPRMFKKTFMDMFKQQKEYPKMAEQYFENRNRDIQDDNLEKFLQRLMQPTKNCLSLTERADKQIKIITEE